MTDTETTPATEPTAERKYVDVLGGFAIAQEQAESLLVWLQDPRGKPFFDLLKRSERDRVVGLITAGNTDPAADAAVLNKLRGRWAMADQVCSLPMELAAAVLHPRTESEITRPATTTTPPKR